MLSIGEIISGIFMVRLGTLNVKAAGLTSIVEGCRRFKNSGQQLWVMHQRAVIDFQKAENALEELNTEVE